ncbi:hypothetical protein ID856_17850 [Xenorhabdus sp. 18]|uniref:hypothetical protein n=1 Tax=Xenorhabdus doucetiae TaxID=351671 RepID=UPI0019C4B536|nr:hypothetical protein [Xenorhabdus sp. 18]MBD2798347.1 hypothetical protein [Xenorhabdus sp. 18]
MLFSTVVKDTSGHAIPNLNIAISANDQTTLSKVGLMNSAGDILQIQTDKYSGYEYANLITDSRGNLEVYVFPQLKESVLLNLYSRVIESVDQHISKNSLFILDLENAKLNDHPAAPDILQLNGNILSPIKDETSFNIKIPAYPNPKKTDYILFILNDKILDIYTQVLNIDNLGTYSYSLPYSALTMSDKESTFGYILVTESIKILYSYAIGFVYEWGPNGPDESGRIFEFPIVYSSYGVEPSNILPQNYIINYETVSQYLFNGDAALFVEIEADSANENKVNPGDAITVEVFTESSNRGPLTYSETITLPPASNKGTTSKGQVKVPYKIVGNLGADNIDGGSTILYINYYKGSKKSGAYSKIWQAFADTRIAGG